MTTRKALELGVKSIMSDIGVAGDSDHLPDDDSICFAILRARQKIKSCELDEETTDRVLGTAIAVVAERSLGPYAPTLDDVDPESVIGIWYEKAFWAGYIMGCEEVKK